MNLFRSSKSVPFEHLWRQRAKWLTQALIFSGALNIAFLATFIYFVVKERQDSVSFALKPVEKKGESFLLSNEKMLSAYSLLPFQELLIRLENKEMVEEGYAKRDLALACLAAFHHFNLERALGGLALQKRKISFISSEGSEQIDLFIFPGLADYQYQAILHYVQTEKWPFTAKGLFFELKRGELPYDSSLVDAFSLTAEFHAVSTLLSRCHIPLNKELLTSLLAEGEWSILEEFVEQQFKVQDLSMERKRVFLLSYLHCHSKIAARLLLQTDQEYVLKRLEDAEIILLLDLLRPITPDVEQFAKLLLISPRGDAVWRRAAQKLGITSQKREPIPTSLKEDLSKKKAKPTHVVEEGESLWKIARKYHTTVDTLMQLNDLDTERLRPGKVLRLPED